MIKRKKRSVIWKLDKDVLEKIVKDNNTFSDILRNIDLYPHGNNQKTLMLRLQEDHIKYDHIALGRHSRKGKRPNMTLIPLDKILVERSTYSRYSLKIRLIKSELLDNKCYECGIGPTWNNKNLSLQIDHINGTPDDNRIENLRILCPNCHSQTHNFAGKKRKIHKEPKQNWRKLPHPTKRKVIRPEKEELEKMLWEKPTTQIANEFGISDKAIDRWAKSYGINKPPRGYWSKNKGKV